MKPRLRLLLIALAVFVGTALLQVPADRLNGWLASRMANSPLQLQGVSGTLSNGSAAQVTVSNQALLSDLGWQLQAWQLLLGRASFQLAGGRDGTLLDGVAYLLPSGALTLDHFRLTLPVRSILASAQQGFLPFEGQAAADVQHLRLREGWPEKGQGTLIVRGLAWKVGREPVLFGDYQVQFDDDTGGIKASLKSLAGALEVSGDGRLLNDRSYEMNLQLRPRPDAPPMVPNLVRNLGQPDAQGWYHLRRQGSFAAPAAAASTASESP